MATPQENARKILEIIQRSTPYVASNLDDIEEPLISSFAYYLNNVANKANLVYVDSENSPYTVTQSNSIISCNSENGDIEIILPDPIEDGFKASIVHYEGINNVSVTTVSGTDNIGNLTTQEIRNVFRGISVVSQISSSSPEYLITQDSRGKLDNRVRVTKPTDFGETIDSTKVYFIDGVVDMGSTTITVPSTGITIDGFGFGVSRLISSEDNYTMFDGGVTTNGNVFISNIEFDLDGASNSQIFNINNSSSGNEAVELNTVNFYNCPKVGTFTGYRQSLIRNVAYLFCSDGITFDGTWLGGVRIETFISIASSGTFFESGASLEFNNRFISNANLNVPSGSIGYDFTESNFATDELFQLQNGNFSGDGVYVNGITEASTKSRFRNNAGLTDTYVGGAWSITTATATTIAATGSANAVKMAGTTTATNLNWFTQSANNSLRSDSNNPIVVEIKGTLSLTSGNNNQLGVTLRQWDDSTSSYTVISTVEITSNGAGRAENVVLLGLATMNQNDRIEIWVQNDTAIQDITASLGGQLIVSERQS